MQEAKQTIDQPKQWYWSPTETFNVKGEFINLTVHLLQEVLSTPEARKFALALELDKLVGDVMREGIDQGKITDSPPPYPGKHSPTDKNHYSTLNNDKEKQDLFKELTGLQYSTSDVRGEIFEFSITDQGEPIWFGSIWIPKVELDKFQELANKGYKSVNFGYVDGRVHHLNASTPVEGRMSETVKEGYILWIEAYK